MPTKKRHISLTDAKGYRTQYTHCAIPHHRCVSSYNHDIAAYVCAICNNTPEWLTANLWRFHREAVVVICDVLNIPVPTESDIIAAMSPATVPIADAVSIVEAPDSVETIKSTAMPENDAERCVCGNVAGYVGFEGEALCERCWHDVLLNVA